MRLNLTQHGETHQVNIVWAWNSGQNQRDFLNPRDFELLVLAFTHAEEVFHVWA